MAILPSPQECRRKRWCPGKILSIPWKARLQIRLILKTEVPIKAFSRAFLNESCTSSCIPSTILLQSGKGLGVSIRSFGHQSQTYCPKDVTAAFWRLARWALKCQPLLQKNCSKDRSTIARRYADYNLLTCETQQKRSHRDRDTVRFTNVAFPTECVSCIAILIPRRICLGLGFPWNEGMISKPTVYCVYGCPVSWSLWWASRLPADPVSSTSSWSIHCGGMTDEKSRLRPSAVRFRKFVDSAVLASAASLLPSCVSVCSRILTANRSCQSAVSWKPFKRDCRR